MPRIRTRAELRERATRYAGVGSDVVGRVNRFLLEAYGKTWLGMVEGAGANGFGRTRETLVAVDAEPIKLPAPFLYLRALTVFHGGASNAWILPRRTTDSGVHRGYGARGQGSSLTTTHERGAQYIREGPGLEPDGQGGYQQYAQRLRFIPPLQVNDEVDIAYTSQPPSLGDPDDTNDDTISIDVISEEVESVIVGYARLGLATRLKDGEYARALSELGDAVAKAAKEYTSIDQHDALLLRDA